MDAFSFGIITISLMVFIVLGGMILLSTGKKSYGLPFLNFEDDTPPMRIKR